MGENMRMALKQGRGNSESLDVGVRKTMNEK